VLNEVRVSLYLFWSKWVPWVPCSNACMVERKKWRLEAVLPCMGNWLLDKVLHLEKEWLTLPVRTLKNKKWSGSKRY